MSHSGLDPFSDDNNVPEFQLGLSAALNELGWAQLTAVARAGFGGSSSTNRLLTRRAGRARARNSSGNR